MTLEFIVSVVAFCVLLYLIVKGVDNPKQHAILKLMSFLFIVILFLVIGYYGFKSASTCEYLINTTSVNYTINSSQVITDFALSNHTITNNYGLYCYEELGDLPLIFFRMILWFFTVFMAYVFFYYMYHLFKFISDKVSRR